MHIEVDDSLVVEAKKHLCGYASGLSSKEIRSNEDLQMFASGLVTEVLKYFCARSLDDQSFKFIEKYGFSEDSLAAAFIENYATYFEDEHSVDKSVNDDYVFDSLKDSGLDEDPIKEINIPEHPWDDDDSDYELDYYK